MLEPIKLDFNQLSELHKQLLNNYQHDFPLSATPYQDIAETLNVSEFEVLTAFQELSEAKLISRIGSVIAPNKMGCSTLATMLIPPEQLIQTAEILNHYPEINHNYEREHDYNLWFVIIATDAEHLQKIMIDIEQKTGFKVMSLPLLEEYYIDLGFQLR